MPETKKYGPPNIPDTPSKTINDMLKTRCNKVFEQPVKYGLAYYICGVFQAITTLYRTVNPDKTRHSHTIWMVCCGIISFLIILKSYLAYQLIMASAFIFSKILYYGAIAISLFGVGLGVAGMVFFDKDGASPSTRVGSVRVPSAPTATSEKTE